MVSCLPNFCVMDFMYWTFRSSFTSLYKHTSEYIQVWLESCLDILDNYVGYSKHSQLGSMVVNVSENDTEVKITFTVKTPSQNSLQICTIRTIQIHCGKWKVSAIGPEQLVLQTWKNFIGIGQGNLPKKYDICILVFIELQVQMVVKKMLTSNDLWY